MTEDKRTGNLFDMIAEDEDKALAQTRKEIAEEKAAYDALSPSERDAFDEARAERWRMLEQDAADDRWDENDCNDQDLDDDDDDDDDDYGDEDEEEE